MVTRVYMSRLSTGNCELNHFNKTGFVIEIDWVEGEAIACSLVKSLAGASITWAL